MTPPFFRKRKTASEILEDAVHNQKADQVSLGELMHTLHERGFGLLMMVLVLPNCVPVPIPPGMSTVFSVPLLFLAVQMLWGMDSPWLPQFIRRRTIRREMLAKIVSAASPKLKKIEKLLHPRLSFTSTHTGERIIGVFWLIFALSIAVPLPMTNFIPGIGILVMSLGLLSRDGIAILIGIVIGLGGVAFTTLLLWLGKEAVVSLFPFLTSILE